MNQHDLDTAESIKVDPKIWKKLLTLGILRQREDGIVELSKLVV
ncbi:MAG TPA: hypothetical protein VE971_01595 [Candidatus Eisenbacteria bacterium]|nr:hypothetical protein [Candidatus Eisenbacteria bacterium]